VNTKDSLYIDLNDILDTVSEHEVLVVFGDFNAKISSDNSFVAYLLGGYSVGVIVDNRVCLVDMCASPSLIVSRSWFPPL